MARARTTVCGDGNAGDDPGRSNHSLTARAAASAAYRAWTARVSLPAIRLSVCVIIRWAVPIITITTAASITTTSADPG